MILATIVLSAQSPFAPRTTARLLDFGGPVRIDGVPAEFGQTISHGSSVQTGAAAWAVIEVGPTNLVQLGAGSIAQFEFSDLVNRLHLRTGRLGAIFAGFLRDDGPRGRVVVHTPFASLSVRSELFFAAAETAGGALVGFCNGVLQPHGVPPVEDAGFQALRLRVANGNKTESTPQPTPDWARELWADLGRRSGRALVCGQ